MGLQAHVRKVNIIKYAPTSAYSDSFDELARLLDIDLLDTHFEWYISKDTAYKALNKTTNEKIKNIIRDWIENCHDIEDGIYVDWF